MHFAPWVRPVAILLACSAPLAALAQIQHGTLNVVENDGGNTPASVTVTRVAGGQGPWTIIVSDGPDATNRGDYVLDLGAGFTNANGVMIVGPAEGGRTEPSVTYSPYFATPSTERSSTGRYFISQHDSPPGGEVNFEPAFVYFPLADGWIASIGYNSANNGPLTSLVGSPLVSLRTELTATGMGYELIDTSGNAGLYTLRFEGLDLRRDGVILVSGAKNEDNRACISTRIDGTAIINCIDNGAESGGENDPAGFVLIPHGTPGVTMGTITASGHALQRSGDFTLLPFNQPATNGTYRLTIPGEDPTTGTLIVCPHTELTGTTVDNPVFVIPQADGWLIETRDIEPLPTGLTLQDLSSGDMIFHFAFFKAGVDIQPAPITQPWKVRLNDVVSARFAVTEFNGNNGLGDMRAERVAGSTALDVFDSNRADIGISYLGIRPSAYVDNSLDAIDGVFLGSANEFYRDNSATGGVSGWTTFSFDNAEARLHRAEGTNEEINSNFAVAFFPKTLGVPMGADITAHNGSASLAVPYAAVNGGVLLAINWDNDSRVVTSTPLGNQFVLQFWDGITGAASTSSTEYGFVELPYTIPGLVAGHVDVSGALISGVGDFSTGVVARGSAALTRIVIPGVDARTDGVLILTATEGPVSMAWEAADDGAFLVAGYNLATDLVGQAAFQFAYIPFDNPCPNCIGDFDNTCVVDLPDADVILAGLEVTGGATYADGDLNRDFVVNLADIAIFQDLFGRDCEQPLSGPSAPVLLSPDNGATISGTSATLSAEVSDPDGDPVDVTIYGRAVVPNTAAPFTVVVLPDTQYYSESYPQIFANQTQWILDNTVARNIVYVMHLGDIVNQSGVIAQWDNANAALSLLDADPNLPYGLNVGNHDQEPCCSGAPGGTTNYNTYFPYTRYLGVVPWYGGNLGTKNDNNFCTFSGGGMDFLCVNIEFDTSANPAVIDWADQVIKDHPGHRAIGVTHWMCGTGNPASFSTQGAAIYNTLRENPNLFMLYGGHIAGEGRRQDTYDGRTVYTLLADYQSRANGGNGWLRLMEFRPAENKIVVSTYSTWLNQFENDADSSFTLDYDMSFGAFAPIATASVSSGSVVNFDWTGLQPGLHEWYVVVENDGGQAESPVRTFTIAP